MMPPIGCLEGLQLAQIGDVASSHEIMHKSRGSSSSCRRAARSPSSGPRSFTRQSRDKVKDPEPALWPSDSRSSSLGVVFVRL